MQLYFGIIILWLSSEKSPTEAVMEHPVVSSPTVAASIELVSGVVNKSRSPTDILVFCPVCKFSGGVKKGSIDLVQCSVCHVWCHAECITGTQREGDVIDNNVSGQQAQSSVLRHTRSTHAVYAALHVAHWLSARELALKFLCCIQSSVNCMNAPRYRSLCLCYICNV